MATITITYSAAAGAEADIISGWKQHIVGTIGALAALVAAGGSTATLTLAAPVTLANGVTLLMPTGEVMQVNATVTASATVTVNRGVFGTGTGAIASGAAVQVLQYTLPSDFVVQTGLLPWHQQLQASLGPLSAVLGISNTSITLA
jgi:hypothetical protein